MNKGKRNLAECREIEIALPKYAWELTVYALGAAALILKEANMGRPEELIGFAEVIKKKARICG